MASLSFRLPGDYTVAPITGGFLVGLVPETTGGEIRQIAIFPLKQEAIAAAIEIGYAAGVNVWFLEHRSGTSELWVPLSTNRPTRTQR